MNVSFALACLRGSGDSKRYTAGLLYQRQAGSKVNCGPREEVEARGRKWRGVAKLVTFHMTSPTNTKTHNFLSFFGGRAI